MIREVSHVWHWVHKYYQGCSNDHLGLTLTFFWAGSDLCFDAFV